MTLLKKLTAIFDRLIEILAIFTAALIVFLMLMICVEVSMRYLLNRPITGIIEIAEYCLLFITFLPAVWVLKKEGHVAIDIVLSMCKPRTRDMVNAVNSAICAVMSIILAWFGIRVTWEQFAFDVHFSTALMPPAYIIVAVVPFIYLLLIIQFGRRAHKFLRQHPL